MFIIEKESLNNWTKFAAEVGFCWHESEPAKCNTHAAAFLDLLPPGNRVQKWGV
jgi:hypothetical protein